MKINKNILFIANSVNWAEEHPAVAALKNLGKALADLNLDVHYAWSLENGLTLLSESPNTAQSASIWTQKTAVRNRRRSS